MSRSRNVAFDKAAVVLLTALALGCTSERSVEPNGEERSFVYVSLQQDTVVTIIFDADADTIVDSIRSPEWNDAVRVIADPVNPVFALIPYAADELWLYPAGRTQPLGCFSFPYSPVAFVHSPDFVIGSRSGCSGTGSTALYRPPEMSLVFMDTVGLTWPRADEERGLIFGLADSCTETGGLLSSKIGAYDYLNRCFVRTWDIDPDGDGVANQVWRFELDAPRQRVYVTTDSAGIPSLVCHDVRQDVLIWQKPVFAVVGNPRVTPDGSEVWYPEPGGGTQGQRDRTETITIFDSETGTVLTVMDLKEYRVPGHGPVRPRVIRFLPSGDKAYVLCGFNSPGPLLVVDVRTRSVTQSFWQDTPRWPYFMDLGPGE